MKKRIMKKRNPKTFVQHCEHCRQMGVYQHVKHIECFRCRGKGWQDASDIRRNDYYDNHYRRIN